MKIARYLAASILTLIAATAIASGEHAGGHHDAVQAIGQAGKASQVTRTIAVEMTDTMRFKPARITVKQGETVKFVIKNSGKLKHEMVLGTEKELVAHYAVMKKNPEMEHADDNMVTVQPGQSGDIVWQFSRAGHVDFACLQPGHYEAGMKGRVAVNGSAREKKNDAGHSH